MVIRLPYFSRSQLSVILLLGAALMGLYAWRAQLFFPPSPPPPGTLSLTFVEVTGPVAHPGVYSFPKPPTLGEVWAKAGAAGTPPNPDQTIASGSRVEVSIMLLSSFCCCATASKGSSTTRRRMRVMHRNPVKR